MNAAESVTTFAIRRNWKPGPSPGTVIDPELAPVGELLAALDRHLAARELAADEYGFTGAGAARHVGDARVPARYRWLIAFAVEGGSEGWYVHVGAIVAEAHGPDAHGYVDFGFCKVMDSADLAYRIAREAQRFLTASEWN
ncbi:MAG TPA: hypothetical protein VKQ32_09640 [Polyangia bacterium]|nr:hypothetical protein [Polyangia bacterium]